MIINWSPSFWHYVATIYSRYPDNSVARDLIECLTTDESVNYVDVDISKGKVLLSFLPASRVRETSRSQAFSSHLRQQGKVGSTLQKVIEVKVEADLKQFVELFQVLAFANVYDVAIVPISDIWDYYYGDNYVLGSESELHKSCMRHDFCRPWMKFYTDNPNLRLVVATLDGRVAARALIWDNVEVENPVPGMSKVVTYLDRVYAAAPRAKQELLAFMEGKYDITQRMPKNYSEFLTAKGAPLHLRVSQPFPFQHYTGYPYVDTFPFWDHSTNKLQNFPTHPVNHWILRATDGTVQYPHPDTERANL